MSSISVTATDRFAIPNTYMRGSSTTALYTHRFQLKPQNSREIHVINGLKINVLDISYRTTLLLRQTSTFFVKYLTSSVEDYNSKQSVLGLTQPKPDPQHSTAIYNSPGAGPAAAA